jgi:hypothetical protein
MVFEVDGQDVGDSPVRPNTLTAHAKGECDGEQSNRGSFDLRIPVAELTPDHPRFLELAIGLEMCDWWCSTINLDAGLSIFHVELIPSGHE